MIDFAEVRRSCDGMMRPDVYEAIYNAAKGAPDGLFVEMGTAHGASAVCLGTAAKERGLRVKTFDSFRAGGRLNYGDADENERIARRNIERYDLIDTVTVVRRDAADVPDLIDEPISLLMLDCDGRIDRDLTALFDRLVTGAVVIIDDCAKRSRVRDRGNGTCRIDQKHLLTWALTRSLCDNGILVPSHVSYQTWFGVKGKTDIVDWSLSERLEAYASLIFANGELNRV